MGYSVIEHMKNKQNIFKLGLLFEPNGFTDSKVLEENPSLVLGKTNQLYRLA